MEGVFATPTLDVVASKAGGGSVALGGDPEGCGTKAPAPLPVPGVKSETKTDAKDQPGSSSDAKDPKTTEKKGESKKTTARAAGTDAKSKDNSDGTKESGGAALPVKVNAKLCHGSGASYSLDSPTPVNIALKLQELHYYPDPTDKNKSLIDYVPVTVAF